MEIKKQNKQANKQTNKQKTHILHLDRLCSCVLKLLCEVHDAVRVEIEFQRDVPENEMLVLKQCYSFGQIFESR